jgi:hypothetical protein
MPSILAACNPGSSFYFLLLYNPAPSPSGHPLLSGSSNLKTIFTSSCLTLSLAHIAESAELSGAAEAEAHICSMVSDRQICAAIDQTEGMVHFFERPEKFDSDAAVKTLEACMQRAINVAQKLDGMNQDLCTDSIYLSRALSQERQPRWEEEEDPMITNK